MALLTVKQAGVNVEGVFGNWTRSLLVAPDLGSGEWERPVREVAGWGSRFDGPGTPQPRQVAIPLRCTPSSSVVDLEHAGRAEVKALNTLYNPYLGERRWSFGSTDSDTEVTVEHHLWARVSQIFPWRDNPVPGAQLETGQRRRGYLNYPILLTAAFPWFCLEEDPVTGDHSGLAGTVDNTGLIPTGWQLRVTMGAGTGINLDPFSVSINGSTLDLVWDTDVDLDGDDVLVLEWYYPDSIISRYGFVSYYLDEGAGDPLGKGLVTPDMTTFDAMPWLPASTSSIAVSAAFTGAPSGSTCELNVTSLHGSV